MIRKIDEIKECVEISCKEYEKQFKALLIAIEAGQPSLARFASKKERELKRLSCSINYDSTEGSVYKGKDKLRVVVSLPWRLKSYHGM